MKFGSLFAQELRLRENRREGTWHVDEVFLRMNGRRFYLWRAVDEHGQVLDVLARERRDADAAERFPRRLLDHGGDVPERIVTDKLASYAAAQKRIPALSAAKHIHVRAATRLEQSGRAVPPAHAGSGAPYAALQIPRPSAAVPLYLQSHLQSLPTSPAPAHRCLLPHHHAGSLSDLAQDHPGSCLT